MKAFLDSPKIQQKYITRLQNHFKLDEIIKGQYWEDEKGCAVGCTVHSNSHKCYEIELGIPEWVARLEDALFEGMSNKDAKEFPLKFLESITVGFDNWQHIYHQLCVFVLENICKDIYNKTVVKIICDIITLHKIESKDVSAWSAAASTAKFAAELTARSAAEIAVASTESARFAVASTAMFAAELTARSAAEIAVASTVSAWSAAASTAKFAAELTARSAAEIAAELTARSVAGFAAYKSIADKLLELLEAEK